MKNGRNLLVGFLLLCAVALGISACGSDSDGGGDGGTSADRGELSGTIEIWDTEYEGLPDYTKAIDQIDAEFEKLHPGVTVDRIAQPFEGFEALARAAFTAGEGPDMMMLQDGTAGVLSFEKGLEPMNDLFNQEQQEELTQWSSATPGFTEDSDRDRYGVPIGLVGHVFYYNKDLFEKAGLPREFEPESWEEVREAGEKLKAAGIQPFVGGNKEGLENAWWLAVGLQTEATAEQRAEILEEKIPYTDQVFVDGYGPEFEMQEAGLYSANRYTTELLNGSAEFAAGKGAMILGFWNAVLFWGEYNPELGEENVGTFLTPGADTVLTAAAFVGSVPKFAKNKDAAVALLEYETSKEGMEILVEVGGWMPNRADVDLADDAPVQAKELLQISQERETESSPAIAFAGAVQYGPMATEINQALQGRISLEDALDAMQETAEKSSP